MVVTCAASDSSRSMTTPRSRAVTDASAEHQDIVAVDPVHKLTQAEPQQL